MFQKNIGNVYIDNQFPSTQNISKVWLWWCSLLQYGISSWESWLCNRKGGSLRLRGCTRKCTGDKFSFTMIRSVGERKRNEEWANGSNFFFSQPLVSTKSEENWNLCLRFWKDEDLRNAKIYFLRLLRFLPSFFFLSLVIPKYVFRLLKSGAKLNKMPGSHILCRFWIQNSPVWYKDTMTQW